jgi:hypothetical protein
MQVLGLVVYYVSDLGLVVEIKVKGTFAIGYIFEGDVLVLMEGSV